MALSPPSTRGRFIWLLRYAYVIAALATAAMGWLTASGAMTRLMPMPASRVSAPPLFWAFIDYIWCVQIGVFLTLFGVMVFHVVRPQWWGKLVCAFAAVSWNGFCLVGLARGLFHFDAAIKTILAAGGAMACVGALHQWLDPYIDGSRVRRLFKH
jgi:hypothetical protein